MKPPVASARGFLLLAIMWRNVIARDFSKPHELTSFQILTFSPDMAQNRDLPNHGRSTTVSLGPSCGPLASDCESTNPLHQPFNTDKKFPIKSRDLRRFQVFSAGQTNKYRPGGTGPSKSRFWDEIPEIDDLRLTKTEILRIAPILA